MPKVDNGPVGAGVRGCGLVRCNAGVVGCGFDVMRDDVRCDCERNKRDGIIVPMKIALWRVRTFRYVVPASFHL